MEQPRSRHRFRRSSRRAITAAVTTLTVAITVAITLVVPATPATAVTYARDVLNGSERPWVVSIWSNPRGGAPTQQCTGSLIAPDWVLTAAHCIQGIAKPLQVRTGGSTSATSSTYDVDGFITHPQYQEGSFVNDIGLLHLSRRVPTAGPNRAQVAKLPPANDTALFERYGQDLALYGWGRDETGAVGRLRSTSQRDITGKGVAVIGKGFDAKKMIAAGRYEVSKRVYSGACMGDSGGPLATPTPLPVVVGVVSFGAVNCSSKLPTVYVRVASYVTWIEGAKKAVLTQLEKAKTSGSVVDITVNGSSASVVVTVDGLKPKEQIELRCSDGNFELVTVVRSGQTRVRNIAAGEYTCFARPYKTTNPWTKIGSVRVS